MPPPDPSDGEHENVRPPRHRDGRPQVIVAGSQHCNVQKYKRAGYLDIKSWVWQMENYFQFARVPQKQWVHGMIANMHPQHFLEVKSLRHLSYPVFRAKLLAIFKEPNLEQALMNELFQCKQGTEESLFEYMARVQNLVDKSFRRHDAESKQKISVSAFCAGLLDQEAAKFITLQAKGSVPKALNIAASVGAYSARPPKLRK